MINVELITPERVVFNDQVDMIVAPSERGELGILPNHAPLLAKLAPGELRLKTGDGVRYLAVTGGFIEVHHGSRVSVFAETAEFADQIDVERARLSAEKAKGQLASQDLSAVELAEVEAALTRALLRLKIAGVQRKHSSAAPASY